MQIIDCEQGTPEWHAARAGRVTASRIADVMAFSAKDGRPLAGRTNYEAELTCEILTGQVNTDGFMSGPMQRGKDLEAEARDVYELLTGREVTQVGFVLHPTIERAGASPDGLVGEDGCLEIKCPNTATHIDFLLNDTIPKKYHLQMQWQMRCTDRQWCDYASYDPRLPAEMALRYVRVHRDNRLLDEVEEQVLAMLNSVEGQVAELLLKYGLGAAAA